MKRLLASLLIILCAGRLPASESVEPKASSGIKTKVSAHFDDPAGLLPSDPAWIQGWDEKIEKFELATGLKIFVQFHLKSPSAEEDKKPGAYMHALAGNLGTVRSGALAVYFADENDWRLWIGDDTVPTFVGQAGTAKKFTESGEMHKAKEAFLSSAHARGETVFAAANNAGQVDPVPAATPSPLRLKFWTEVLLGDLLVKLGPK